MKKTLFALSLASLLAPAGYAAPTPHEQLTAMAQAMVEADARDDPMLATYLGIAGRDGELVIPTEARRSAAIARLKNRRVQLEAVRKLAGPSLALVDADDATLLRAQIDERLDELLVRQTDRKNYAGPALDIVGVIYTQFLHLPIAGRDGATAEDVMPAWMDIIGRLEKAPAYIEAGQKLVTHPGKLYGVAGQKEIDGAPDFLGGALTAAAREQLAGDPAAWRRFTTARDAVLATVARTHAYIAAHVDAWPQNFAMGRAAYDQMLQREQLLPFSAKDIEGMARDELAHGWAEEAWLTSLSTRRQVAFGPDSGGGMAPSGPALIDYYRERIAQLRSFVADQDLITIPDWLGSMAVVETPKFQQPVSPGAAMQPPRLFAQSANGYYFITPPESLKEAADRLDMNEDFDHDRILSTAAHEAMPGHFLQLSIARRHSDYIRRLQHSGVFAEGWAYYGEEMFVRLGLYGDDLDARLFTARWERVRGARAIVDGKLASGEWTLAQAATFFEEQSGFTTSASEAAVAGYALRPGYVISYTVGRLQLEELLAQYLHRMGDKGSLHDFHDRLLSYGTTPFAIVGPELLADLDKPASVVRANANY
ncbi:MAG: DUF885 domain-containing protein [Pseudomonadota bacterium]|nr:DUF885 domain-containing protein [Pseudomonadota bacterium]